MFDPPEPGTATATDATTPDAPFAPPRVLSVRTTQFYAHDWAAFVAWCASAQAAPLPADAATLVAYLSAAGSRLGPGAIARRLAAIADQHRRHDLVASTAHPAVKAALQAMRRAATPRPGPAPAPALLARMIAACPGDLAGLRDRALLALMAATGLGRAALVSLDAENLRNTPTDCHLRVVADGGWRRFQLSRQPVVANCPVQALEDWLRVSNTCFGPVFRKIDRWGNIEHHRLGADAVRRVLARRAPSRARPAAHDAAAPDPDPA